MWRERAIRWGWLVMILNIAISIMNIGFGYSHYAKHEWIAMSVSWCLVGMNGCVAWAQYKSVQRMKQDLKDLMWNTLSTPSEELR